MEAVVSPTSSAVSSSCCEVVYSLHSSCKLTYMLVHQDVIVGERRFQYEAEVSKNPLNYDSWFDYIRLEEAAGDYDKVREVCAMASM